MDLKKQAEYLTKIGYGVLPLYDYEKFPKVKNWRNYKYKEKDFKQSNLTGIGLLTGIQLDNGNYFHVVDIDVYKEISKTDWFYILLYKLKIKNVVFQTTVSGGLHIFFQTDKQFKKKIFEIDKSQKIELLGNGQQVVGFNSKAFSTKTNDYGQYKLYGNIEKLPYIDSKLVKKFFTVKQQKLNKTINKIHEIKEKNKLEEFKNLNQKILSKIGGLENLLISLNIDYIDNGSYFKIYSPFFEDGENPDCVIYKNEDKTPVVFETHIGESYSIIDLIDVVTGNWKNWIKQQKII